MKVAIAWSGGKDSCAALHELRSMPGYEVATLLTTVTRDYDLISMHGVPRSLLHMQAEALGVPLIEVYIPAECTNADYEAAMTIACAHLVERGIHAVAFGDLFLEDIRVYRETQMAKTSLKAIFPVWGRGTREFITEFIATGFKAVTCCVDLNVLSDRFAGRLLDERFIRELPEGVDPCGENGEFHTFVFDGPGFTCPIPFKVGERITRGRFHYCDLEHASSVRGLGGI